MLHGPKKHNRGVHVTLVVVLVKIPRTLVSNHPSSKISNSSCVGVSIFSITLLQVNSKYRITQSVGTQAVRVNSYWTRLKVGYCLIDSAQYYSNEEQVGTPFKEPGVPLSEIYATNKMITADADAEGFTSESHKE
jgi:hypothetical protein